MNGYLVFDILKRKYFLFRYNLKLKIRESIERHIQGGQYITDRFSFKYF